ncbi:MAG: TonB family protein [Opitutaceae bacterium]|jgi:TonB family protein|nr:TonB family protein [Opitutaceae bacterium]MBP9913351.1 TonB family protein [Opitutaceae bacterium]
MNKMKSFTGAALVSALLATSAFASTVAVNPALQRDLPRPDTVVAPSNLPRQYLGTTVKLSFIVDETGQPHDIQVISSSNRSLANSLVPALAQWRFTPAMENGVPVAKRVILPLKLTNES